MVLKKKILIGLIVSTIVLCISRLINLFFSFKIELISILTNEKKKKVLLTTKHLFLYFYILNYSLSWILVLKSAVKCIKIVLNNRIKINASFFFFFLLNIRISS